MKVALVYDRVNKFGGAERILLTLHEIFPEAPLYTSVYDHIRAPWAKEFQVYTSFIQKFPLPKNAHEYYPFFMGLAFESFCFDEFDLVISITHEFAKAIITKPQTLHLCYCLNPVGYLWDNNGDYFSQSSWWFRNATKPVVKYLRWYDRIIAQRPDIYLAISKTVQARIKKHYKRECQVIYPPVDITANPDLVSKVQNKGDYYLIVSRLVSQKRLDIAIEAFNQLGLPLKVIGVGRMFGSLKAISKSNIEFLGYLTDEQVAQYYKSCRAVVIPGEEDFNLVAVEAQSFGKPVIAYGKGGVTETVIEGKTGCFFREKNANSLIEAINNFNKQLRSFKAEDCYENARRFSKERFKREFLDYVRYLKTDY